MRKDSPLLRFYYDKLPSKKEGGPGPKPKYEDWIKTVNPDFISNDYNLKDAYNELPYNVTKAWANDPRKNHLPDTYKLPNHESFSNQSKYYDSYTPGVGGYWGPGEENFIRNPKVGPPIPSAKWMGQYKEGGGNSSSLDYHNPLRKDGGDISIPVLTNPKWVTKYGPGGQTGDPNKPYSKSNPQGYVSMKNNQDWFDSHANWTNTGNPEWDAKARELLMTGRFGVDPNSGALIKLNPSEFTSLSNEYKRQATDKRTWTPAQKQQAWEKQVTPQIVQSTKDLMTNPVMMAPGAILTGGMAAGIPAIAETAAAIAPALETTIGGVPGLTAGNLINAGFAYQGAKNLPNVASTWKNVYNKPTLGNLVEATAQTATTALDMLPFLHGAAKGMPSVIQDVNQIFNPEVPKNIIQSRVIGVQHGMDALPKGYNAQYFGRGRYTPPATGELAPTLKEYPPTPWSVDDQPGLHLQSTMSNGPISKIVEPKTGLVNLDQALAIIGKESGGKEKLELVNKGLKNYYGDDIPKKVDFNDFRRIIQDQLIPLDRQFVDHASNYGLGRIGYPSPKRKSFEFAIDAAKRQVAQAEEWAQINKNLPEEYHRFNNEILAEARKNLEKNLQEFKNLPLENQTLLLSNEFNFGRGSGAHSNPESTLGHIHFLRDSETPNVLTVTQIQSDAFQGTNRTMPKSKEAAEFSLSNMEKHQESLKKLYESAKPKMESLDLDGNPRWYELPDGTLISKEQYFEGISNQQKLNTLQKAEIENFSQKSLLDKNHQDRFLQELVGYAGERGDVHKVRLPTSETAAKIQGYTKGTGQINRESLSPEELKIVESFGYSPEQNTILKKYAEYPKRIKKLFGTDANLVKDSKGNSWYEFDIPESFKQGMGEIRAFKYGGLTKAAEGKEYKGVSVVDYLATKGYSGDKGFRKDLAEKYGVEDYDYSAGKNTELLNKLRQDDSILQDIKPSFAPVPVERIEGMHDKTMRTTPRSLPSPAINPAVANLMFTNIRPTQDSAKMPNLNNPFGSVTGGKKVVITGAPSLTGFAPDSAKGKALASFTTKKQTSSTELPVKEEETSIFDNIGNTISGYEDALASYTMKAAKGVSDVFNTAQDYALIAKNGIKRKIGLMQGDDDVETKSTIKIPKLSNNPEVSKEFTPMTPPVTVGDTIIDKQDRGSRYYHLPEVIDLDQVKLGYHNRYGLGSTSDAQGNTKAQGLIITPFRTEQKGGIDNDNNGENTIRKYKDNEIVDWQIYGGVDDQGKFHLDFGRNMKGKGYNMADFRYADIKGIAKDAKGNYIYGSETDNDKFAKVPHLIDVTGQQRPLNLLVTKRGKNQETTFGKNTGGRVILTTPDFKKKVLVSGSLKDVDNAIESFKKDNKLASVRLIFLDNGSYNRGLRTRDGVIRKNDWSVHDHSNEGGGAGFYYYGSGGPIVTREGFKQGPPPEGSHYRIPSDILYNPTPYTIKATSDNGISKILQPFDTSNVKFPGATYVDEKEYKDGGVLRNYYEDKVKQKSGKNKTKSMVNREKKVKLDYKLKYKID